MFLSIPADAAELGLGTFAVYILAALFMGAVLAAAEAAAGRSSGDLMLTLILLPAAVCTAILIINGSIGMGIAVAGAFSLVRFRSMPGTALEIAALFEAMTVGLACGAGCPQYAAVFTAAACAVTLCYAAVMRRRSKERQRRTLRITVPEDLDYCGMFDDILDRYTAGWQLEQVKTMNLGSLLRLSYNITLKNAGHEKEMMDALRCRNGNLEIVCALQGMRDDIL